VHPPRSDEKINQGEIFEDSRIGPRGNLLGNKTGAISLIGNNPIEHPP